MGAIEVDSVVCINNLEGIPLLEDGSIDLVVTSPPYNTNYSKSWGRRRYTFYSDNLEEGEYRSYLGEVFRLLLPKMSDTGSVFLNLKNRVSGGRLVSTSWVEGIMCDWLLVGMCIWDVRGFFNPRRKGYSSNYEVIYHYAKTDDYKWCSHKSLPGMLHIPGVRSNARERVNHPCQFPEELVAEFIHSCTDEGDLVLDPWNGSGTTCAVAKKLCRHYIGMDILPEYVDIARGRVSMLW